MFCLQNEYAAYKHNIVSAAFPNIANILLTSFPFQCNHITFSKKKHRNICDICLCHPSYEVLLQIALFYGVSVDWLVGISNTPYTDESIAAGYKAAVERQNRIDPDSTIGNVVAVVTVHINQENFVEQLLSSRKKRSPEEEKQYREMIRVMSSNDIFFRNATFLNDMEHKQKDVESNYSTVLQKGVDWFLKKKISTEELKRLEKKQVERYNLFFKFINKEITEPIYKLSNITNFEKTKIKKAQHCSMYLRTILCF